MARWRRSQQQLPAKCREDRGPENATGFGLGRVAGVFAPRWSPDGRHLVAISYDNSKLMLFDASTHQWRKIGPAVSQIGYLAWSADSSTIYADTLLTKDPAYLRIRINDGKVERVFEFKNIRTYPGQFGPAGWTGLAPTDTPLTVRDI